MFAFLRDFFACLIFANRFALVAYVGACVCMLILIYTDQSLEVWIFLIIMILYSLTLGTTVCLTTLETYRWALDMLNDDERTGKYQSLARAKKKFGYCGVVGTELAIRHYRAYH